jgi:hypothetical protein
MILENSTSKINWVNTVSLFKILFLFLLDRLEKSRNYSNVDKMNLSSFNEPSLQNNNLEKSVLN